MAITKEDVLEFISNLSVLELSELVKEFEEKFGVSAAPVMVAGAVAGGAAEAAEPLCPPHGGGDVGTHGLRRQVRQDVLPV